jgi:hypothetical protein
MEAKGYLGGIFLGHMALIPRRKELSYFIPRI